MKTEKEAILELTDSVLHLVDDIISVGLLTQITQAEREAEWKHPA